MTKTPALQDDARIELVPYDDAWPERFKTEESLLQETLAPWLAGPLEHFGSTAVAGLAAKPIIDIMAPVRSLGDSEAAIAWVCSKAGYVHYPYMPDVMHWFCKPSPQHRTHHLHLVPFGSVLWLERLAFRDALRRHPALAKAYEALKLDLARQFSTDRDAYTNAKAPFVKGVLSKFASAP